MSPEASPSAALPLTVRAVRVPTAVIPVALDGSRALFKVPEAILVALTVLVVAEAAKPKSDLTSASALEISVFPSCHCANSPPLIVPVVSTVPVFVVHPELLSN